MPEEASIVGGGRKVTDLDVSIVCKCNTLSHNQRPIYLCLRPIFNMFTFIAGHTLLHYNDRPIILCRSYSHNNFLSAKSMDQFYSTNYCEYIRPENYTVEAQVLFSLVLKNHGMSHLSFTPCATIGKPMFLKGSFEEFKE